MPIMAKAVLETKVSKQKGALKKCKAQHEHSNTFPAEPVTVRCKAADNRSSIACNVDPKLPRTAVNFTYTVGVRWWLAFIAVACISFGSRLYKITEPPQVCWDETHFGKMASWYINNTFFFDVHPPLGKMLIGLAGKVTGYNGTFPFTKPGDKYEDTEYVGMRIFCCILGSAVVPMCYCIVWDLSRSLVAAIFTAALLTFDTALVTLSQYILLDAPLIFFIVAATFCLVRFQQYASRPFTFVWWLWMTLTGTFLSCAMSVKFVGLFVILLAGFTTARDLWNLLGDLSLSLVVVLKHLAARAVCLILLPTLLYIVFFAVHLDILHKSGSGDGFFSSAFQSRLEGNELYNANMPHEVAYGSVVSLKNYRTGGAYLHSHWHLYPEGVGARQQQVTTYGHKDENNMWRLTPADRDVTANDTDITIVANGDLIRLQHVETGRNLHSHRVRAPLTQRHHQLTCYGEKGVGDVNDVFRVEIVGAQDHQSLNTVRSVFRLIHHSTGCAVHSHNKRLPKWGWEQLEATCNPNIKDKHTLWNIEQVLDARLPNISFSVYAPSFLERFLESHAVMLQGNSGLKPHEGEVTSQPWQWPINFRGQPFSGGDFRVYLLGNPVIWWGNLVAMVTYAALRLGHGVRKQRGYVDPKHTAVHRERMFEGADWLLLGWALHYLPFWSMGRVLYFHHYMPAFIYSCMLSGILLDYVMTSLCHSFGKESSIAYHVCCGSALSAVVYSFYLFSPLSYGMTGALADNETSIMYGLKWMDSWQI